jgi:hypothetical protein
MHVFGRTAWESNPPDLERGSRAVLKNPRHNGKLIAVSKIKRMTVKSTSNDFLLR